MSKKIRMQRIAVIIAIVTATVILPVAAQVLAIIGKRIFLDFRRPATGHANLVSGVGSAEMDRSSG